AVLLEAPLDWVEDAGVHDLEEAPRRGERLAAVARGRHVDPVLLQLLVPAEPEHVDGPVAGGADRAPARPAQRSELGPGSRSRDARHLDLRPVIAAVGRPCDEEVVGRGARARATAVVGVPDVRVTEVWARFRVVRPDLLLV